MPHWHDVRVASRHASADGLTALTLDVSGTPLVGSHTFPGQFVRLSLPDLGEGMFALASEPHGAGSDFEVLVQQSSDLSQALATLPMGSKLKMTAPEGTGFPIEEAKTRDVLLFATGSGISAIRSVVQVLRARRSEFRDVTLYFGARTPTGFAYANELAHWQQERIRVVRTVSQPGDSGWDGLSGYVQEHLPHGAIQDAVAFLCGRPEMVTGVTEALRDRGLRAEDIHLNY